MKTETKQSLAANLLILVGTLGRLLPHPANVTPVGAMALVGGAKLSKFWKWTIPFVALALSDFLLGVFFDVKPWLYTTPFVYASFAVNIWLGSKIGESNRYIKLGGLSILGSLQFFLISNLGVWAEGMLYSKTLEGLLQCYTMALPFLKNTLLGDLCWSFGLFLAIDKVEVWFQKRTLQNA